MIEKAQSQKSFRHSILMRKTWASQTFYYAGTQRSQAAS